MFIYHTEKTTPESNSLDWSLCKRQCVLQEKKSGMRLLPFQFFQNCMEKVDSVDVLSFSLPLFKTVCQRQKAIPVCRMMYFFPALRLAFYKNFALMRQNQGWRLKRCWTIPILICSGKYFPERSNTDPAVVQHGLHDGDDPRKNSPASSLPNEADREKISKAREILLQHIGEPL